MYEYTTSVVFRVMSFFVHEPNSTAVQVNRRGNYGMAESLHPTENNTRDYSSNPQI